MDCEKNFAKYIRLFITHNSCRSYSKFSYSTLKLSATSIKPGQYVLVTTSVENIGAVAADEVSE